MNVVMAVDEVRSAPEAIDKGFELARDFRRQRVGFELVHQGAARHRRERRERAPSQGGGALAHRPQKPGKSNNHRAPPPPRPDLEGLQSARLLSPKALRSPPR